MFHGAIAIQLLAETDLLLTDAFLILAAHVVSGRDARPDAALRLPPPIEPEDRGR